MYANIKCTTQRKCNYAGAKMFVITNKFCDVGELQYPVFTSSEYLPRSQLLTIWITESRSALRWEGSFRQKSSHILEKDLIIYVLSSCILWNHVWYQSTCLLAALLHIIDYFLSVSPIMNVTSNCHVKHNVDSWSSMNGVPSKFLLVWQLVFLLVWQLVYILDSLFYSYYFTLYLSYIDCEPTKAKQ